jgi:hypothetical protein
VAEGSRGGADDELGGRAELSVVLAALKLAAERGVESGLEAAGAGGRSLARMSGCGAGCRVAAGRDLAASTMTLPHDIALVALTLKSKPLVALTLKSKPLVALTLNP